MCTSHADCVSAFDFSQCCGSCAGYHMDEFEEDPCLAMSQAEAACAPAAHACDGLDCVSVSTCDVDGDGHDAVCLETGGCDVSNNGACPSGTEDNGTVCFYATEG